MQENVDLCEGVYDKFDTQFPEEKEAPAGAVSMELAKYVKNNIISEVDAIDKCQDKQEFYRFLAQLG